MKYAYLIFVKCLLSSRL